jgi:integrase
MAEKLSDGFARRIAPADTTWYISDTAKNNLQLIVTPAGAKYWAFYKKWQGKPVRSKLGDVHEMSYMAAVTAAADRLARLQGGKGNPASGSAAEVVRQGKTLGDVLDRYIKSLKTDDARQNYSYNTVKLRRVHGEIAVEDFTAVVFRRFLEEHHREHSGLVRTLVSQVRAAWNYCQKNSIQYIDPALPNPGSKLIKELEWLRPMGSYAVSWEDDQWSAIMRGIQQAREAGVTAELHLLCVEMMLLTGARSNEIKTLRVTEIKGDHILKDVHKTYGRTGRPKRIYFGPRGQDVLNRAAVERIRIRYTGEYVFPSAGNRKSHAGHVSHVEFITRQIRPFTGLDNLTPHNFRSGYINFALDNGVPLEIVSENVGHENTMTTLKSYVRNRPSRLREGAGRVDAAFSALFAHLSGTGEGHATGL